MLSKKLSYKEEKLISRKYKQDNKLKIKKMLSNIMIFIFGIMKENQINKLLMLLSLKWILQKQIQKN